MTTRDLPAPIVPAHVDMRGEPFPHDLLVKLARMQFGATEAQVIAMVESMGWKRKGDGWIMGDFGNA